MRKIALLLTTAVSSCSAFADYEVRLADGGTHVSISWTAPTDAVAPLKLAPRGAAWGLKPQVSDVRCGEDPLPQDAAGHWLAPAGCPKVTWRVVPDLVAAEGADASEQRTLAVGSTRWILLAEPTSILRPLGIDSASRIRAAPGAPRLVGATPVEEGAFRVPAVNSGPEFYVLGATEFVRRRLGALEVIHVADDAPRVKQLGLEALHASALRYLAQAVPMPKAADPRDRSLLVVWLGVAESRGGAGGAAGSRSFVANYVIGSPANKRRNSALTMMIVAHEQFHQLVDVLRSDRPPQPSPVWFNESLAHYYGLKALMAADRSKEAKAVRDRFIDRDRAVEHGLVELNRRHESGDQTVYDLFYSQGATFWYEIDTAIQAATRGKRSLDDYVVQLLREPMASDGSLPAAFVDRIRRVAGGRVDRALATYVAGGR